MVSLPGRWIRSALLIGGTVRAPATAFFCTRGESKHLKDLQLAIASLALPRGQRTSRWAEGRRASEGE
jgi:hypothetical protein